MQRLINRDEKSRFSREVPAGGDPLPASRKEKYSNLLFLGFNAVFLIALFWMLPALGTGFPQPDAQASAPAPYINATISRTEMGRTVHPDRVAPLLQYAKLDFRPLRPLMPANR